jgi:hypothetical protein
MSLPIIQKALGGRYPKAVDEDMLTWLNRVAGPLIDELRANWNGLEPRLAGHIEANAAAIAAVDTTDWLPYSTMIDEALGDVYSLQVGSPGAGDLQATPVGFYWAYEYSL